ncbi:MAG: translation initiation factor IF-2, partial [Bacteroidia bacterium]|nr:translation initiation factor IF-2 [Bacteroidia bacterium]
MAEAEKTIRLSKAVKDFNLSLDHIVDFLSKKGFKIKSDLNTKLPGDAYALLLKEFLGDKSAKEEAQQIAQSKIRKETALILDAEETKKAPVPREEDAKEILIKNVHTGTEETIAETPDKSTKAKKPAEKEKEVIKAKGEKVEGPKVVGKIEITEETRDKKKTGGRKKAVSAEKPAEPVTEPKPATRRKKKAEPENEEVPVADKVAETKPVETPDQTTPVAPSEKPPGEEGTTEPPKEEIHRIEVAKLTGLNILGKIELPKEPEKKKPVASSSGAVEDRGKKKRKRTERKTGSQPVPQDRLREQGRATGSTDKKFSRGHKPPEKSELTDKEIQDQIKATLARLSSGGKSRSSKMRKARREERAEEQEAIAAEAAGSKVIKATEFVTANELAKLMDVNVTDIISTCMSLGIFVSINQRLDAETLTVVAEEFGFTVEFVSADVQDVIRTEEDKPEDLLPRPPIVTVMGHVDHGKTSLLDYIRKTNVIAGEAGGITQHIGAYSVTLDNGKQITFLDTPGHEAFTAMRARGAKVTDVAIIVIAADDNVMPQTVEAINHAQAANVPMVFAINKVDKPDAHPEKIKEQLSKMNILVEDWGGKYQCQEISAKKGQNVEALLEKVLLEAELLDLKANPNRRANGTVIESMLDKGRGYVMTVLVHSGKLHVGDVILAGCYSGRVKALFNERGFRIKEAGPSDPAQILGMTGAPQAGDLFNVMEDEREARDIANKRLQLQREQGIRTHKHITLDEIGRRLAIGSFKELNVIVKGDVDGSIEALADSLLKLSTQEVQINIIHKSVGQITESDVLLASASNAIIIGFQVRPSVNARKLAETEEIEIRLYSIIYNAINEIKQAMEGMLAPEFQEKI